MIKIIINSVQQNWKMVHVFGNFYMAFPSIEQLFRVACFHKFFLLTKKEDML